MIHSQERLQLTRLRDMDQTDVINRNLQQIQQQANNKLSGIVWSMQDNTRSASFPLYDNQSTLYQCGDGLWIMKEHDWTALTLTFHYGMFHSGAEQGADLDWDFGLSINPGDRMAIADCVQWGHEGVRQNELNNASTIENRHQYQSGIISNVTAHPDGTRLRAGRYLIEPFVRYAGGGITGYSWVQNSADFTHFTIQEHPPQPDLTP